MKTIFIIFTVTIIITVVLCIIDYFYYDKKLPDNSIKEIDNKIQNYKNKLKLETDILKQSELLDLIEYWEQQKDKLVKHNRKNAIS